jgi:TonB family protein
MRRLIGTLALLALCASLSLAQRPEEKPPRLQPVEILSTAELYYPPMSVGFGTVVLEVTIDASGAIENVKVIKDIKSLTPEAVKCVKKWKFKPAELDGKPERATIAVAFTFNNPFRGATY